MGPQLCACGEAWQGLVHVLCAFAFARVLAQVVQGFVWHFRSEQLQMFELAPQMNLPGTYL